VSDSRDPQNAPRRPPGLRFISVDNVLAGRSEISSAEARIPENRRMPAHPAPGPFRPADPRGGTNIRTRSTKLSEKLVLLVSRCRIPFLNNLWSRTSNLHRDSRKQNRCLIGDMILTRKTGLLKTANYEVKNRQTDSNRKRLSPSGFPRFTVKITFLELQHTAPPRATDCHNAPNS
jgi:hypothetical protein